jgi:uncharacterized protein YndB with AHSA1/START domain
MGLHLQEREKAELTHLEDDVFAIHTEIFVDAPPEKVWAVLTDFERLPEWSNNLVGLEGDFREGGQIAVNIKVGVLRQTIQHEVKFFEGGRSFGWSEPFMPGISDRHIYQVNPTHDSKTTELLVRRKRTRADVVGCHLPHVVISLRQIQSLYLPPQVKSRF